MKKYNYIRRIVGKAINLPTNNDQFTLYNHFVEIQSGMRGFFAATLYAGTDRYSGEVATFSFDYWRTHLYVESTENAKVSEAIINAFRFYYPGPLSVSDDTVGEDEE